MATITGSGNNSRTTLSEIHAGSRSWEVDLKTTHSQIKLMQQELSNRGFSTQGTDGIYGNNTASAVRNFQSSRGLTADGYFGKKSLEALENMMGRHLDPSDPSCGGGNPPGGGGTQTYSFSANNAVNYALNHSDNSGNVACPKRNSSFPTINGDNDCADFVHQCLVAGGAPMFNGWYYPLPGAPSGWSDSKWQLTKSGLDRLISKGFVQQVEYNQVQPGDLVYTYKATATPTPYTHVTLAVSSNVTVGGQFGCRVCGNTDNQNNAFKALTAANCRVYRVKSNLVGDGSEKKVYIPTAGNGGYYI